MPGSCTLIIEKEIGLGELLATLLAEAIEGSEIILVPDLMNAEKILNERKPGLIVSTFPGPRVSDDMTWPIVKMCDTLGLGDIPIIGLSTKLFLSDVNPAIYGLTAILGEPFDNELFIATVLAIHISHTLHEVSLTLDQQMENIPATEHGLIYNEPTSHFMPSIFIPSR